MNTAISPRKKSPTSATPTTSSPAPAAPDPLTTAANESARRLDAAHRTLFREAAGEPLTVDAVDLVSALGWDARQLKQAKRDASCALSAVRSFKATTGADARAKQLRAKRDAEVPKLREQIAALEKQIGELEYGPREAERQAEQHIEATKTIRLNAPQFVKQRYRLVDDVRIAPLREKWSTMRGELGTLAGLMTHDPSKPEHRHTFEATHDRNSDQPWMLRDAHNRTVIDPQAWRRFIVEEQVEERHDALANEVAELESQIANLEREVGSTLDYWLAVADQPEASA